MTALQPDDPDTLGGYRLQGRIGSGGQAVVYLGMAPSGEKAAVKVFDAQWLDDPDAPLHLAAEVEAMRGVAAFGTARLLAQHLDAHPPYLVSEYIPGLNLAQAVHDRGPLRDGELDRFALAVLTVLRAIHAADLVHRDLKPSNVVLGPDGPRILDFGIVARGGVVVDGCWTARRPLLRSTSTPGRRRSPSPRQDGCRTPRGWPRSPMLHFPGCRWGCPRSCAVACPPTRRPDPPWSRRWIWCWPPRIRNGVRRPPRCRPGEPRTPLRRR